eukprot:gene3684-3732_t
MPRPAQASPPRIVSLNPCSDAILVEVADPAQILAISAYSRDPASASLPADVASRFAITHGTVEEVIALRPDVVIDGAYVAPATAGAYRRLGLRLETMGTQRNIAGALADVRRLAVLAGHPDRGEALVQRIVAGLARAAPPPGQRPADAVVWEWGGIVAGSDTLIGDLLMRTGRCWRIRRGCCLPWGPIACCIILRWRHCPAWCAPIFPPGCSIAAAPR